jgi:hypothetical protein
MWILVSGAKGENESGKSIPGIQIINYFND